MPIKIHGKDYKTVAERVNEFRGAYADTFSIETDIIRWEGGDCVIRATIRNVSTGAIVATGIAHEVYGSTNINKTSHVENCETSAVGRALAAFGLAGSEYASADEVSTAVIQQQVKDATDRLLRHNEALRENMNAVQALKDFIADGDLQGAVETLYGIPEDVREALWVAPTKGGIFTTAEIAVMKSDEFSAARTKHFEGRQ